MELSKNQKIEGKEGNVKLDAYNEWKKHLNELREASKKRKLTKDLNERQKLQSFLKEKGIGTAFHYIPLHSAPAGKEFCRYVGEAQILRQQTC